MLNNLRQLVWDTKNHQYEIALRNKLNDCIPKGVQMFWIGYRFLQMKPKIHLPRKRKMQAHNLLTCSNMHLLFYFIYFHAFFTNHRTYVKRNVIFHTNIFKAQNSPHSHVCCSVIGPFVFFSGTFIIFLFLVQGCLCSIKVCAANFIDGSATSHQHFRGTEMTSAQLLQLYLNSCAPFAFIWRGWGAGEVRLQSKKEKAPRAWVTHPGNCAFYLLKHPFPPPLFAGKQDVDISFIHLCTWKKMHSDKLILGTIIIYV